MTRPRIPLAALAIAALVPVAPQQSAPAKWTVVVDAGHGGSAPGMRARLKDGNGIDEKVITLGIAKRVHDLLRKRGVEVVMTRDRDMDVGLVERGRIANEAHGDLFLSIHVNAAGPAERDPRAVRGFETYFLDEAKTEDERRVEAMENESVKFETSGPSTQSNALAYLINDMAQNEHLRESYELASTIQRGVGPTHPGRSRGVRQANFAVLRHAYMPAVLVETGYGSNPTEASWLASEAGQREIAASIVDATLEYLDRYEKRVKPPVPQR